MAVYDLPTDIIVSNVEVTQSTPQFVTTSLNNKRRTKNRGLHQFKGTFDITITGDREQRRFEGWLAKMGGRLNQFNLILGGRFTVNSTRLRNVTLSTDAGVGSTTLNVSSFIGDLWEGDFFKLPNDNKVYVALNDLSSVGGVLNVQPPLRLQQTAGAPMEFENLSVLAMLDSDEQPVTYAEGGIITEYSCKWEEYL